MADSSTISAQRDTRKGLLRQSSAFAAFEALASQAEEHLEAQTAPLHTVPPQYTAQQYRSQLQGQAQQQEGPCSEHQEEAEEEEEEQAQKSDTIKGRAIAKTALFVKEKMRKYPECFPTYAIVKLRANQKPPSSEQKITAKKHAPPTMSPQRPKKIKIKAAAVQKVQLFVASALKKEFYLHGGFPPYAICTAAAVKSKGKKRKIIGGENSSGDSNKAKKRANTVPSRPVRNTNDLSERYAEMIERRVTLNEQSKAIGPIVLLQQAMDALKYEIETKQSYNIGDCCGRASSYFQMLLDTLCVNQNDGFRRLTRQDMLEVVENAAEIVSERRLNAADTY